MLKKFAEGLVFGSGFAIAFISLWYVAAYLISPAFISSQIENATNKQLADIRARTPQSMLGETGGVFQPVTPFHELELEEQIKKASVIALAKYEPSSDGKVKAIIKEFLKKEPGATIYYELGDEYAPSSYYPKDDRDYGDGLVMFFTGSPAMMQMSMSYSGGRIGGLADLPVELFRQKCNAPGG